MKIKLILKKAELFEKLAQSTFDERNLALKYVEELKFALEHGFAHIPSFQKELVEMHNQLANMIGSRDAATLLINQAKIGVNLESVSYNTPDWVISPDKVEFFDYSYSNKFINYLNLLGVTFQQEERTLGSYHESILCQVFTLSHAEGIRVTDSLIADSPKYD